MAKTSGAKFRMLFRNFWLDEKIQMLARDDRADEIYVILNCMLGIYAGGDNSIAGIYELHREAFQTFGGLSFERSTNALNYINKEIPTILEYDFKNHVVYVKNFFSYQSAYKTGTSCVPGLMEGFKRTYEKNPDFWHDLSLRNRQQLGKILLAVAKRPIKDEFTLEVQEEQAMFMDKLISLKDLPTPPKKNPKPITIQKMIPDSENEIII